MSAPPAVTETPTHVVVMFTHDVDGSAVAKPAIGGLPIFKEVHSSDSCWATARSDDRRTTRIKKTATASALRTLVRTPRAHTRERIPNFTGKGPQNVEGDRRDI